MRTSIKKLEDGTFNLTFHKAGYKASTPMTVEELTLLHSNIISVLPDLAVPAELKQAINKIIDAYKLLHNEETTDNSSLPRPVEPSQGTES